MEAGYATRWGWCVCMCAVSVRVWLGRVSGPAVAAHLVRSVTTSFDCARESAQTYTLNAHKHTHAARAHIQGKTAVCIALALANPPVGLPRASDSIFQPNGDKTIYPLKCTLILTKVALIGQWEDEIKRW